MVAVSVLGQLTSQESTYDIYREPTYEEIKDEMPTRKKASWHITLEQIDEMICLQREGWTYRQIGKMMDVSHSAVHWYLSKPDRMIKRYKKIWKQ